MNIEIENVDLKNSLFADFTIDLIAKKLELVNRTLDFSSIHNLQGNSQLLKIAFYNQLSEELKSN